MNYDNNEEKCDKEPSKLKKISQGVLGVLIVAFVILVYFARSYNASYKMQYILMTIFILIVFILSPFMDIFKLIKERGFTLKNALLTIFYIFTFSCVVICSYEIFLSTGIRDWDKNKIVYEVAIVCLGIIIVTKSLQDLILELKKCKNKELKLLRSIGKIILFLYTLGVPLYQMYEPNKVVVLNNLKKPCAFKIKKIKSKENLNSEDREICVIKDIKVIDEFYNELKNKKIYNIRLLNHVKYSILEENSYPYYEIIPLYKIGDEYRNFNIVEDGYIGKIKLLKYHETICRNYSYEDKDLKYNIGLSPELINIIKKRINSSSDI
ncbi:hypothetical protein ACFIJ5_10075 [Haloimpatiens sp. FM7330]|uniref:hypothetical protein n=1 Tax=Haloimpatiens sp. FM7330 TaxID=3298610 RepID=UPI003631DA7A